MGTRHLIIIYYNGKYVLAQYGQWDGYPEGQGFKILKFLSTPGETTNLKSNLHLLHAATPDEIKAIDEECSQADREEKQRKPGHFLSMDDMALNLRYPSLSRDTGANILNLIADTKDDKPIIIREVKESLQFAMHPICEWIYDIDLDANKLKVYSGQVAAFDSDAAPSTLVLSLQPGDLSEWEMLKNPVPQLLVEFDIEKLPGEEEFVGQIKKQLSELEGEENDDEGEEDGEEEHVNA